ncbi:hypothetical protein ACS0TY_031233 [Phlomoides rotata]
MARNDVVWNDVKPLEWKSVIVLVIKPQQQTHCVCWDKPRASFWKVNVDDAFFSNSTHTCVNMILRDDQGVFVACKTIVLATFYDVDEGEALGLFEALS